MAPFRKHQLACVCGLPLEESAPKRFRIMHCRGCRGDWVPSEELDKLWQSAHLGNEEQVRAEIRKAKARLCPVCGSKMDACSIRSAQYEQCSVHGAWFDEGGLGLALVEQRSKASNRELIVSPERFCIERAIDRTNSDIRGEMWFGGGLYALVGVPISWLAFGASPLFGLGTVAMLFVFFFTVLGKERRGALTQRSASAVRTLLTAPSEIVKVTHQQVLTSGDTEDWVVVETATGETAHLYAEDDVETLITALSRHCPQAEKSSPKRFDKRTAKF